MKHGIQISILFVGLFLAYLVHSNADVTIANTKATYILESSRDLDDVAQRLSDTLDEIYRAQRTIARLPGVRTLDMNSMKSMDSSMNRGGAVLDRNTQITIQEIYNALATSISVSEIYIVPLSLDPDGVDPSGRRPTEPIVTFDKFIIGKAMENGHGVEVGAAGGSHDVEEVEIYEYRIMREQLDVLAGRYPTIEQVVDLEYPSLSSSPVITCDNTRFDPDHPDDEHRKGLVISVPIFDSDGILTGCVSVVILTGNFADILPSGDYAISNLGTGYFVPPAYHGQWKESVEFSRVAEADPGLIYSMAKYVPSTGINSEWLVWSGSPDWKFWSRSDVEAILHARMIGLLSVALLIGVAYVSTSFLFKAYKRLERTNAGLAGAIDDRTKELNDSRDMAFLALDREIEISHELEYQRQALDQHAIVSIADVGGKIIYVNDKFCQISGYSREELVGQNHRMLKSDEHPKEFYQDLWRSISSGKVWKGEIKNATKDGGYYWVSATIVPFKDASGKIQKYVAVRADITERKDNNELLNESNSTLKKALQNEKTMMAKLEETLEELEVLASTDKLTGLPNRAVLNEHIQKSIVDARDSGSKFGVLFFDFDRFKMINDSLGHDVGDALLCSIADTFRSELRQEDTVARFGGDEFVVLLSNLSEWGDAETKAKSLLEAFRVPHRLGDHLVVSTASIGLVTNEHNQTEAGDFTRDADSAMYHAKSEGKDRVVVFDKRMHEEAIDRLVLEIDLRDAIEDGQLRLEYQPIMELATGSLKGFEALVRWDHPTRGLIGPDVFIPIAEESGIITKIGRWIFEESACQAREWNDEFGADRPISINVNVSKRQLLDPEFLGVVSACQRKFNLYDSQLLIEITESVIVDARSNVIPLLNEIRGLGFQIVMDDFGTGVSSLSTLHSYPVDVLKIDQSFIKMLSGDRSLLAVVSAITNLAENLGIHTVAEGVETQEIVGALQTIGCTWGQGYHFAKPLSVRDAHDFIAECHAIGKRAA